MKKGGLSKFVEEAVRRRVLQGTVQDIRARNAGTDPEEIQRIADEAVSEVRAERRTCALKYAPPDGILDEFREIALFHALGAQERAQG